MMVTIKITKKARKHLDEIQHTLSSASPSKALKASHASKDFRCQTCGKVKASDQFYEVKVKNINTVIGRRSIRRVRASPHCIECNTTATNLRRYKAQIKAEGVVSFVDAMRKKEIQLALMTQALSEVQGV